MNEDEYYYSFGYNKLIYDQVVLSLGELQMSVKHPSPTEQVRILPQPIRFNE